MNAAIKMVVGLGNPGKSYSSTRHNAGYRILDLLEKRKTCDGLLHRPKVFMNSIGGPVAKEVRKKGFQWQEILVVCDDFSIPLPRLRIRLRGSSGGHNGLDSILQAAGTLEVPRLRAGIGPVPADMDPADFVLKPFRKGEIPTVELLISRAADAVECAVRYNLETAMNRFNAEAA